MKFTFGQKLMMTFFGVQFASEFLKERERMNSKSLTNSQYDYITTQIVECNTYQSLIREGKTPQEITQILNIHPMNKQKFEMLTGMPWPVSE